MNSADGPRRDSSAKTKITNRKKGSPKELEMTTHIDESGARLFSFTIDANTAQIVKFESLDASGARHELSDEEKANLVKEAGEENLEEALEEAFEAGIACVLGGGNKHEKTEESDEDAELRHLLLAPLMEHSAAKHLLQREFLHRAILDTLIQHSMKPHSEAPEASSPSTPGLQ
jgi:hypothetical protein